VVSDRFLLANVAYQGHAGGLDPADVWQVGKVAMMGVEPDLTFLLDMAPQQAAARLGGDLDRMERRGDEYRRRLRAGFLDEAARRPEKIAVIEAAGSVQEVRSRVRQAASRTMPDWQERLDSVAKRSFSQDENG
jgi:dTMP kinase